MAAQIGVVISKIGSKSFSQFIPPSSSEVMIQLAKNSNLCKGSYVLIRDARTNKEYFGYVSEVMNYSELLSAGDYYKKILERGIKPNEFIENIYDDVYMFTLLAEVTLMYEMEASGVKKRSETAPADGSPVYRALPQHITSFLELSSDSNSGRIFLGSLYSDENVKFTPDANRLLTGHVCVFGQTGSGKSYAAGVIIEELIEKKVPVIVFDHMGDYISMDKGVDGNKGLEIITVTPGKDLKIDPEDLLKAENILLSFGITEAQINLLRDAMNYARTLGYRGINAMNWLLNYTKNKSGKTTKLVTNLYVIGRQYGYSSATVDGLRWKINVMKDLGILGSGYDIRHFIQPGKLTIVDLRHVKEVTLRTLIVADMLRKLIEARESNSVPPTVVVIEEAHNYAPYEETPSSIMIRDLVRGARHKGISVIIVTQRPAGLHTDVVNIANTHIVFRLKGRDLEYIANFLPLSREEIKDIETLPQGVAYISGPCIPEGLALKVKFRKRRTVHGGESIRIIT